MGLAKEFYSVIKTQEKYQRFVLITGVLKFSMVSILSDLNNLTGLTMDPRKLFKIGCAFDWEKRNLGPWLIA